MDYGEKFVHCFFKLNKNRLAAIRVLITGFYEAAMGVFEFNVAQ